MSAGLAGALTTRWRRWLFSPGDLRALALFRMGWALAMLADEVHDWDRADLYSPERYHQPIVVWATPLGMGAYHAVIRVAAIGCLAALVGVLPRAGALLTSVANAYLMATDVLLFRNHVYLGCLLGFLLAASPCGRAFSLEAVVRRAWQRVARGDGPASPTTLPVVAWAPVQLIQAQVLIVYAWSVVNKLRPSFLDGWTLQQELPHALGESPIAMWLRGGAWRQAAALHWIASDRAMATCSCAAVLSEAFLVIGLPSRRLRLCAALVGLSLHGAIFLSMGVLTFGLLMVSTYPLFFARGSGRVVSMEGAEAGDR